MWTLYPSKNLLWLRTCLKFMIRFGICYSEKNINPRHDILSMFFQIFLNRILNRFLTLFALTLYFHLYSLAFICSFLAQCNFQTLPNISFEWFDLNFNVQTPEVSQEYSWQMWMSIPGIGDWQARYFWASKWWVYGGWRPVDGKYQSRSGHTIRQSSK